MRYWGSESTVTGSRKPRRRKAKTKTTIASGGSLKDYPFLRAFYQHQAYISSRLQRLLLFLIAAGLIYAFVLGDGGIIQIALLRHERGELSKDVTELRTNTQILTDEIARLRDDEGAIEKVARERYGYVYPDELVYKIVPEAKKN